MAKQTKHDLFGSDKNTSAQKPVECLGMTFPNDEARRTYFLEKLREKLKDPEFRKIEGFPIGDDEDILALSDPPYYTACPNPFLDTFIAFHGKPYVATTETYHREPFAADVSEGKNDPIYNAHSYHTKVPYKAVMRYILHYTAPGDVVLDGFCGTGMTGIAAHFCGDTATVESLGYSVARTSGDITDSAGTRVSKLGPRFAILNDLSPAATFIAYNYQVAVDFEAFSFHASRILKEVWDELGWMYATTHSDGKTQGTINFIVWSELFNCPDCSGEIVFVKEALDRNNNSVREDFPCPHCGTTLTFAKLDLIYETKTDSATHEPIKCPKRTPVFVNYSVGTRRYEKEPDKTDLALCDRIARLPVPSALPTHRLPDMQMTRVGRIHTIALSHVHHFFFPRTAHIISAFWQRASVVTDHRIRALLLFWLESQLVNLSLRNRYRPGVSFPYNPLTGVFYVPAMVSEASVFTAYKNKLKRIATAFDGYAPVSERSRLETRAASGMSVPDACVDYIFTDPPFGENIYYSDLNFFVEAWLRVFTNTAPEAIVDRVKGKGLADYQRMMQDCFRNYYRILKPGRWMTVEFHNSKNSVWNAIQEALQHAGFVIADVRPIFDTFKSQLLVAQRLTGSDFV
jgi:predicted RNA methylase